jgi:putative nucleotidyltransferase with HDIG domain
MLRRLFQVIHALTAKMESADHQLVAAFLNSQEQALYYAMDTNSQKHGVKVAQTCLKLAHSPTSIDSILLVKAALLHDIGKEQGDLTTFYRIAFVITDKLFPSLGQAIVNHSQLLFLRKIQHAFFVLYAHPELGSQKAEHAGLEQGLIKLIANHHTSYVSGEPIELTILRQADNLN